MRRKASSKLKRNKKAKTVRSGNDKKRNVSRGKNEWQLNAILSE